MYRSCHHDLVCMAKMILKFRLDVEGALVTRSNGNRAERESIKLFE